MNIDDLLGKRLLLAIVVDTTNILLRDTERGMALGLGGLLPQLHGPCIVILILVRAIAVDVQQAVQRHH